MEEETNHKNVLEQAGGALDLKNEEIKKIAKEKTELETKLEQKNLDFSISEQNSNFLKKKNTWLLSKIKELESSKEDLHSFMDERGNENKKMINEIFENLRSTEEENFEHEMKINELEANILQLENSENFMKLSNKNFQTLQSFYEEQCTKNEQHNTELVENLDQIYQVVSQVVKSKIFENFSVEKKNKILEEKVSALEKIFDIVKSAFLKKMSYHNEKFNRLTNSQINNYKKLLDLSNKYHKLKIKNSNYQEKIKKLKEKLKTQEPKIDPLRVLKHIFGENYSQYVTRDTKNLEEFLEKIEKLDDYLWKMKTDVSKMEKHKVTLKEDLHNKNLQLREMYRLECDIGFEEAFKIKNQLNELTKKNNSLENKIKDLEDKNEIMKIQRNCDKKIAFERKNNISALIFLNDILKKRLYQHEKEIDFTNFNLKFFRKERIISTRQNDLLLTLEDLQNSDEKLKIGNFQLENKLKKEKKKIAELESKIKQMGNSLQSCKEKIDDYETHNLLEVKGKKNLQKFEEYINDLNKESMIKEADMIKKDVEIQLKNNAELEAKNLRMETELNILKSTLGVLEERNQKLEEIVRGKHFFGNLNKNPEMKKTLELLFNGDLRYKTELEQLKTQNKALKLRILSFRSGFETINNFYKESGLKSEKLYEKISEMYQSFKDRIFDSKELFNELDMIQGLETENQQLKNKIELEKRITRNMLDNLELKNNFLLELNLITESRSKNLTTMVVEFSRKVDKLQRERHKLEANSILERLKEYLKLKMEHLDSLSENYKIELDKFNKENETSKEKMQNLDSDLKKIFEGETKIFSDLKNEFEKKFEGIMSSAKAQIEEAKSKASMGVTEKENEIEQLKAKLEKASFEGKDEMIVKIKELSKEIKSLKGNIINLELKEKLKEMTSEIMIEEIQQNQGLIVGGELEKVKVEYEEKIKILEKNLENEKIQSQNNQTQEAQNLRKEISELKIENQNLKLNNENIAQEKKNLIEEKENLIGEKENLLKEKEELTEKVNKSGEEIEDGGFKEKFEKIQETRKADIQFCKDIFSEWEKEKQEDELKSDTEAKFKKIEEHFSTLIDWLINEEENNEFTKEEMANLA